MYTPAWGNAACSMHTSLAPRHSSRSSGLLPLLLLILVLSVHLDEGCAHWAEQLQGRNIVIVTYLITNKNDDVQTEPINILDIFGGNYFIPFILLLDKNSRTFFLLWQSWNNHYFHMCTHTTQWGRTKTLSSSIQLSYLVVFTQAGWGWSAVNPVSMKF